MAAASAWATEQGSDLRFARASWLAYTRETSSKKLSERVANRV